MLGPVWPPLPLINQKNTEYIVCVTIFGWKLKTKTNFLVISDKNLLFILYFQVAWQLFFKSVRQVVTFISIFRLALIQLHRYIELISVLTKRYLNRKEDEITNKITNESMNHLKEDLKKKLLDKSQCQI